MKELNRNALLILYEDLVSTTSELNVVLVESSDIH